MAEIYLDFRQLDQAEEQLEYVKSLDADDAQMNVLYARLELLRNRIEESLLYAQKSHCERTGIARCTRTARPHPYAAWKHKGCSSCAAKTIALIHSDQHEQGRQLMQGYARKPPTNATIQVTFIRKLLEFSKTKQAAVALKAALKTLPHTPELHLIKAEFERPIRIMPWHIGV